MYHGLYFCCLPPRGITLVGATCCCATQKTLPGEVLKPSKHCYYILSSFCCEYNGLIVSRPGNAFSHWKQKVVKFSRFVLDVVQGRLQIAIHLFLQLSCQNKATDLLSPSELGYDYQLYSIHNTSVMYTFCNQFIPIMIVTSLCECIGQRRVVL